MKEQVIELAKQAGIEFQATTGITGKTKVMTYGSQPIEKIELLIKLVRNAALEDAKQLFSQPHQEYFGREAQDAIESLKEPTP